MLKLSVSIKISKSRHLKINFIDSSNIIEGSLESLSKSFETYLEKLNFPYDFVTKETLNYVGLTPDKKYYENISEEEY
jgi:hypothetical protein